MDFKRRARERAIALEIAQAIHSALGSSTKPEDLGEKNRDLVCAKFADAFDSHGVTDEAAGARILSYVPGVLAELNYSFYELNRKIDIAVAATVHGR
jgi:hypothetical protein